MNMLKTMLLMGVLTVALVLLGSYFGGQGGALTALIFAGAMNFVSYFFSDKIVLKMNRARVVGRAEAPVLFEVVEGLTRRAGMPMPKVAIIPSPQPNAFATGRDPEHAVVAATEGILRILDRDELEGVMAHELAHVRHRDILIASVAATLAGAIMYVTRFGLFFGGGDRDRGPAGGILALAAIILAPIAAFLIQAAITRSREFAADEGGAEMSRKPRSLASALQKLEAGAKQLPMPVNPAASHLYIVKPFRGGGIGSLFSTHPPTAKRVERLLELPTRA
ncbi:MAG TPA: zinc metalloprotease HtpX [Gemmatimonadota bacterium]|nr:zinc metalloprotease HtpX [Gemmatimonadota bacterium]